MLGPKLEEVLNLVDTLPELGATFARARKEIARIRILGFDYFGPDGVILIVEFPHPFKEQRDVHLPCTEQAQAPHGLGTTDSGPVNQVVLAFCPGPFPEELSSMSIKSCVNSVVQEEESHRKDVDIIQTGTGEDQPAPRGEKSIITVGGVKIILGYSPPIYVG
jgi:hypothetical protein